MSAAPDQANSGELEAAKKAIAAALLDANVNLLFGSPVDISVLPDYLDIVDNPKDLGTVLADVESSLEGSGTYKTALDVYKDVSLVWTNCTKYNDRPEDKAIVDICKRSAKLFDKEWRKAGLEVPKGEASHLPTGVELGEMEPLPLRLLTNFEVTSAADPTALRSLDTLHQERAIGGSLLISGNLIPVGTDPKKETGQPLSPAEPLVDWIVEYSGPEVAIWAATDSAWYKLLYPTDRYESMYTSAMQGVALAREVLEELAAGEDAGDISALVERLAGNIGSPDPSRRRGTLTKEAKDLAIAHVETKIGRRKFRSRRKRRGIGLNASSVKRPRGGGAMGRITSRSRLGPGGEALPEDFASGFFIGDEIDAISDDDMPDDFQISDTEEAAAAAAAADAYEGPVKARQRAWKRIKYWNRRSEEEEKQRIAEIALSKEEKKADAGRSEPPNPVCSSRLPLKCLPDILMVWDFAQSFRDVLQLPPFSLTALEAALDPGPRVRKNESYWKTEDDNEESKVPLDEKEGPEGSTVVKEANGVVKKEEEKVENEDTPMEDAAPAPTDAITDAEENKKIEGSVSPYEGTPGPEGLPPSTNTEGKKRESVPWQRKGVKIAPQNVIEDPTVKTRMQKGFVPAPSSKALDMAEATGGDTRGTGTSAATPTLSASKIKLKINGGSGNAAEDAAAAPHADNPVAAALSAAQAVQDAYNQMIKSKYGLSPDDIAAMPALDRDSGASGLLLRDLVVSLASAAFGLLPGAAAAASGQAPPKSAKMTNPDAEHPSWPERLANTVWSAPTSPPEARQAALKLAYGDYIDLLPEERLSLLVALTNAALSSEAMIAEISLRVDQFGVTTTRRDGGAGDELDDENGRLAAAAAQAVVPPPPVPQQHIHPSAHPNNVIGETAADAAAAAADAAAPAPAPNTPLELWKKWHAAQNFGIRRPLGIDYRGRRYWALGRQSGAFRVFCEEPGEEGRWGWYEGQSIQDLIFWLSSVSIRCESALITALRAAPLPFSTPTQSAPARYLVNNELATLRADGYRGLTLPLLRGEWNNRREGTANTPPTNEQRIPLAVDVMLGAVPLWFKGEVVQRHAMAISDVLASAQYGRDAARALLETERLLAAEGHVTQEWLDIWQGPWRRAVASLGDVRDVPLCTAALQTHVKTAPDIIPRPAFMKIATESNFVLTIPALGDTVIVLRAGLLQHLDRYMQIVGVAEAPVAGANTSTRNEVGNGVNTGGKLVKEEENGAPSAAAGGAVSAISIGKTDDDDELDGDGDDAENDNEEALDNNNNTTATAPSASIVAPSASRGKLNLLPAPKIKEESLPRVKREWDALRSRVAALRPAERYTVRSIVYRRHLADDADLVKDEEAAGTAALRAPVAWVFLRPARYGPKHQLPTGDIVLPVAIVSGLPDYLLKVEAYVSGMRVAWQPGDKFRMFFGGKISEKTLRKVKAGGTWHKGEVVAVEPVAPGRYASLEEKEKYDPWESVVVKWDHLAEEYVDRVNPWELEIDPEEETRRGDEARRLQQAAARSQRARASSRRAPDDPLAAQQAAEWEEEDAHLAVLAAQADRANLLLAIHKAKPEPEETVFNDAAYGPMALQTQQVLLATLGAPALMAHAAAAAAAAAASGQQKTSGNAPGAAGSGSTKGPAAGIMASAGGFGAGGSGSGTAGTRSAGAVPTAPPPSSNMPSGPLKPGQEVPTKVLEALRLLDSSQLTTLLINFYRGLKGKYKIPVFAHRELDLHAVWWAVMERGGYETVTANKQWRDICRALPQLDLSGQTSASYNMRLNYERCLLDFENYLASGQYEADVTAKRAPVHTHLTDINVTRFTIPGAYPPLPPAPVENNTAGAAATAAATAAAVAAAYNGEAAAHGPESATVLAPAGTAHNQVSDVQIPVVQSLGAQLRKSGGTAIGQIVQRYWPEEGGWWDASITDYNAETKEHQLTYNVGQPDESFEWVNLAEVGNEEFRLKNNEIENGDDVVGAQPEENVNEPVEVPPNGEDRVPETGAVEGMDVDNA